VKGEILELKEEETFNTMLTSSNGSLPRDPRLNERSEAMESLVARRLCGIRVPEGPHRNVNFMGVKPGPAKCATSRR